MNEVVRLSIIEVLYLVLILSVSILTVYIGITLARLNDVLRDLKRVSRSLSAAVESIDIIKQKAVDTIVKAADVVIAKLDGQNNTESGVEIEEIKEE